MNGKMSATVVTIAILLSTTAILSEARADDSDKFKVRVFANGVNSQTGELHTCVKLESGESKCKDVDPFSNGRAGVTEIGVFSFPRSASSDGEWFEACIDAGNGDQGCNFSTNTDANRVEEITVDLHGWQPVDFEYTDQSNDEYEGKQSSEVYVDGDNNNVEVNQGLNVGDFVSDVKRTVDDLFAN